MQREFALCGEHFVARFHVDAVGDVAVRFRGIAQQRNLIAIAADERCQRIAKLVPRGVSPDGIVLGILLVHFLSRGVTVKNCSKYGRGARSDGAIVQINLVGRDEELLSHLGPVCVFVFVEQRMVGQGRSLLELSKEISAQGQGSGDSGRGAGEKMATVEQRGTSRGRERYTTRLTLTTEG